MISTFAELAAIVAECFLITRLMVHYFGYRSEKYRCWKSLSLFSILFLVDCIGTFWVPKEIVFFFGFILSSFVFAVLFLRGRLLEKVLIVMVANLLTCLVNLFVMNMTSVLSNTPVSELIVATDVNRVIGLFCTKFLYFIATQCLLWLRKKEPYHFRIHEWIVVISVFVITLLIGLSMYMITTQSAMTSQICLIITFLLLILNIIIFVVIRKINLSSQKETEKELLRLQLKQQQSEMEQLEKKYQEISILRHDYQNKINCIGTLLSKSEESDARKYVEKILGTDFKEVQARVHCSSSVISAVINEKIEKATEKGIETSCRIVVTIPEYLEYDLSILLANLLDNAIEACEKNDIPSQIILTITDTAGYYRVVVKNTVQVSVLRTNQNLESNKQEKERHGWGLKSVRELVEGHQGILDIYEKDGMFIVSMKLIKDE